ncbi:MAG: L-lactate permease [bacterium]
MNGVTILAIIALIPIGLLFYLGYVLVWQQFHSMPIGLGLTAFLALVVWRMSILSIIASCVQGVLLSVQLIILIISVIFFVEVMRGSGVTNAMRPAFSHISPDRRIQAIFVAWLFEGCLESVLGFAATSGVCATILIGIGFPPACAVMLGVMGTVVASAFSAGGAPILFGVAKGLEQQPQFASWLNASGMDFERYLHFIGAQVSVVHGVVGVFMPLLMIMMMTRFFGRQQTWTEGLSAAPFALFCGLAFVVPYILAAVFVGPEFPSRIGGLVGMAVVMTALRTGFLTPPDKWDFLPIPQWQRAWSAGPYQPPPPLTPMPSWMPWFPYVLLVTLIIISRLPDSPVQALLQPYYVQKPNFMGTDINFTFQPLFMFHCLLLVSVAVVTMFMHRFRGAGDYFGQRMTMPASHAVLNMPLTMSIICIYINSNVNHSGWPGMFASIAQWISSMSISQWIMPFLTPFLAAGGSHFAFVSLYSDLIFSPFQHDVGQSLGISGAFFVALQVSGASVGNLFAGHYVTGTCIAVEKTGVAGPTNKKNQLFMIGYLFFMGLIALFFVHFVPLASVLLPLYQR